MARGVGRNVDGTLGTGQARPGQASSPVAGDSPGGLIHPHQPRRQTSLLYPNTNHCMLYFVCWYTCYTVTHADISII